MRKLTINNKEYTFKFSIEASLYNECTESVMNMLMSVGDAHGEAASIDGEDADAKDRLMSVMRKTVSTIANIPQTALTLFYAGLMEQHGASGDGSVTSILEAKDLLAEYLRESEGNFYDVMNLMIECMGEDHFFDLTGLSKVLSKLEVGGEEKKPKKK